MVYLHRTALHLAGSDASWARALSPQCLVHGVGEGRDRQGTSEDFPCARHWASSLRSRLPSQHPCVEDGSTVTRCRAGGFIQGPDWGQGEVKVRGEFSNALSFWAGRCLLILSLCLLVDSLPTWPQPCPLCNLSHVLSGSELFFRIQTLSHQRQQTSQPPHSSPGSLHGLASAVWQLSGKAAGPAARQGPGLEPKLWSQRALFQQSQNLQFQECNP